MLTNRNERFNKEGGFHSSRSLLRVASPRKLDYIRKVSFLFLWLYFSLLAHFHVSFLNVKMFSKQYKVVLISYG